MRAVIMLVVLARVAAAQTSPGALATVHASLACADCHTSTNALAGDLCLACHKALAARVANNEGLHVATDVAGKACEACHHEHKGASFDLRGWSAMAGGEHAFDHARAGWVL